MSEKEFIFNFEVTLVADVKPIWMIPEIDWSQVDFVD